MDVVWQPEALSSRELDGLLTEPIRRSHVWGDEDLVQRIVVTARLETRSRKQKALRLLRELSTQESISAEMFVHDSGRVFQVPT